MRLFRFCFALFVIAATNQSLRAAEVPDPLRLVPHQADLFVQVPHPRQLVETILHMPAFQQLQQFENVRELYDSTNARRARQFLAYYERELGLPWPELLDRLAGGGIVASVKIGLDPAPFLLVVQGTDEALMKRFSELTLKLLEQELARQESKERVVKHTFLNFQTVQLGKDFHAAVVGRALLISNRDSALHLALGQYASGSKHSMASVADVAAARRQLPAGNLAWLWSSTQAIHKAPQAKDIFVLPRNDAILTVAFGGLLDVLGRSPYLCAAFGQDHGNLQLRFWLPRGREGLASALTTHVPPKGQPGSLPLLEPRGILLSESFYLDIGKFWDNRKQLFNAKQVKTFETFDTGTGKFLLGHRFSQLVDQMGPYGRFVLVHQPDKGYHKQPEARLPAFGLVVSMRDPAFAKSMDGILRAGALLAGFRVRLKMVTEEHDGCKLVGYRFAEDAPFPQDVGNIRFNFTPCFMTVGDQFCVCSTLELGRQMIPLLKKEQAAGRKSWPDVGRVRVYADGVAQTLATFKDQLLAQTILSEALTPEEARHQVNDLIDWVRRLGSIREQTRYSAHEFRIDVEFHLEAALKAVHK